MSAASRHAAPNIETDRLRLRAHRIADFPDLSAMWADPVVVRHIAGRPSTPEESWSRLLRYAGLWPLLGFGYWAVEERATGRFVGDVGLADFHRDMTPPLGDAPEAGWALAPWSHRKGYATEAMRAVLAWSDVELAGREDGLHRRSGTRGIDPRRGEVRLRRACTRGLQEGSPTIVLRR